jgi:hypothetical protein
VEAGEAPLGGGGTAPEQVLGIAPGASRDEARAAYRRLVRLHHPDHHADASPEVRALHAARLREVMEAWSAIAGHEPRRRPPAPEPPPPPAWVAEDDWAADADLADDVPRTGAHVRSSWAMVPAGLLVAAVVAFAVSVALGSSGLWVTAGALFVAALVAFALAPFFVMMSGRR